MKVFITKRSEDSETGMLYTQEQMIKKIKNMRGCESLNICCISMSKEEYLSLSEEESA